MRIRLERALPFLFNGTRYKSPLDKPFYLRDNQLEIENPAATYRYLLQAAAIVANRQLNLPLLTGTDTLVTLGLPAAFTDLVEFTKSGSPYTKAHQGANGPHVSRVVASKNNLVDNTLTSFLRVTVPNDYIGAVVKLDYIITSNTLSRYRMGGLYISIGRTLNAATSKGSIAYIAEQTLLTGAAETITVTFTLSANTGADNATQTFDVQVTIDVEATLVGFVYSAAELLSAVYGSAATSEITIATV